MLYIHHNSLNKTSFYVLLALIRVPLQGFMVLEIMVYMLVVTNGEKICENNKVSVNKLDVVLRLMSLK